MTSADRAVSLFLRCHAGMDKSETDSCSFVSGRRRLTEGEAATTQAVKHSGLFVRCLILPLEGMVDLEQ